LTVLLWIREAKRINKFCLQAGLKFGKRRLNLDE
jgi:hypothetical protein